METAEREERGWEGLIDGRKAGGLRPSPVTFTGGGRGLEGGLRGDRADVSRGGARSGVATEILCRDPLQPTQFRRHLRPIDATKPMPNELCITRTHKWAFRPIPFFSPESALLRGNGEQGTLLKGRNFSSLVPFVSRYSTDEFCIYI